MNNILVIGAGRSSLSLIEYLLDYASAGACLVTVADVNETLAREKIGSHAYGKAVRFDIRDKTLSA